MLVNVTTDTTPINTYTRIQIVYLRIIIYDYTLRVAIIYYFITNNPLHWDFYK